MIIALRRCSHVPHLCDRLQITRYRFPAQLADLGSYENREWSLCWVPFGDFHMSFRLKNHRRTKVVIAHTRWPVVEGKPPAHPCPQVWCIAYSWAGLDVCKSHDAEVLCSIKRPAALIGMSQGMTAPWIIWACVSWMVSLMRISSFWDFSVKAVDGPIAKVNFFFSFFFGYIVPVGFS